ncbi:hypothetical protein GW17_00030726 [Ensete ventricosum]|nr:hypothetical protein GW17_00030726 [Ensete ventricosum]RZS11607.1 hypothetical protein BHM03_00042954 [Ensete ventricosum]
MLGQCPVWPSDCGSNDATGTRREITESSPKVLGACWGFVGSSSKVIESLSKYTGGSPEDDRDSLGVHQRHSEDEEYNQEEVENLVLMAINNKEFAKGIGKLIRKTPGDHRRKTIRLAARMSEAVGLAGLHQDAVIFFIQSSLSLLYVSRHYVTPTFPTSPSHRGKSNLMRGCLISVVGKPQRVHHMEIIYPCIPNPDGEDEGGQASSSLAISTQWISTAKLLKSDFATLAQREGGE